MNYIDKRVETEYGKGTVIDIDLPLSGFNHASRLVVKLNNPTKLVCQPAVFFLKDIKILNNE